MMHVLHIYSRIVILLLASIRIFMQEAHPELYIRFYGNRCCWMWVQVSQYASNISAVILSLPVLIVIFMFLKCLSELLS